MKTFNNMEEASKELKARKVIYIPKACPFTEDDMCGNWCALFVHEKKTITLNCGLRGEYTDSP
jgi:hypothetical protein